jgi:hypothetical protein
MKRKMRLIEIGVIIFCFLIGSSGNINAQIVSKTNTLGSMEAFDENGKPFSTQHNEHISGSPMLNPEWGTGVVSYKNGRVISPIQIQFNLQKNELYFSRDGKSFMFTDTVSEFRIIFKESDSAIAQKFRSGYPSIGKNKSTHFYQVLVDNKSKQLISDRSKKLQDAYTYSGGEKSVYREEEVLYLFDVANGKMIEIKSLKNAKPVLISTFPDRKAEIDRIYAEQKSGIKTREEVIALVQALQ